jgi:hypothetical protein
MLEWLAKAGRRGLMLLLAGGLLCGCVSLGGHAPPYGWFERPDPWDPWSAKVRGWQRRERQLPEISPLGTPSVSGSALGAAAANGSSGSDLRAKYRDFRAERKREMARKVARWIQKQAPRHYIEDGAVDHWATLEETLVRDGDDCDGLELLVYHFLRDAGFRPDEVYRAIVYRARDGQHHMVTLWFEDRRDPWVIDPTGAMISGMPRMSQVPGWVPLKIFSEEEEFTVRQQVLSTPRTARIR